MNKQSQINITIPTETFVGLANFLREQGSDRDPVQAVQDAINYWIDNASWKKEDLLPETVHHETRGYQWKEVFLMHGTKIRMMYKGVYFYAEIVGDQFMHEGKVMSPSQFPNRITGTSRNAWRDLEILFPHKKEWRLAGVLRREAKKS